MLASSAPWCAQRLFKKNALDVINFLSALAAGFVLGGFAMHAIPESTAMFKEYLEPRYQPLCTVTLPEMHDMHVSNPPTTPSPPLDTPFPPPPRTQHSALGGPPCGEGVSYPPSVGALHTPPTLTLLIFPSTPPPE